MILSYIIPFLSAKNAFVMASNKEGHVSAYFPQFLDAFPIAFVTIQKQVFKVGSDAYITKLYSNF